MSDELLCPHLSDPWYLRLGKPTGHAFLCLWKGLACAVDHEHVAPITAPPSALHDDLVAFLHVSGHDLPAEDHPLALLVMRRDYTIAVVGRTEEEGQHSDAHLCLLLHVHGSF